ncbi:urease-enhancing factor [Helicobacter acinonychis]|uniref:urease-enhancing factor n=1 Tax=Helicobacter acinonychis TaxID=212 RepID=UPI000CF0A18A|nr:urease-enhancing factor [Helicobacter acinonychis]
MKTIRNGVFIGASLLGGCASVETRFDTLRVACIKDASIEKESCYTPKDFSSPYFTDQTHWDSRF